MIFPLLLMALNFASYRMEVVTVYLIDLLAELLVTARSSTNLGLLEA